MYTNRGNISLIVAVWLAAEDTYDLVYHPNVFSVTEILKPLRSVVLTRQIAAAKGESAIDIMDILPAQLGHAVHTAIEEAWLGNYKQAMKNMGIPDSVIDHVHLNAEKEDDPDGIYIYMEKRTVKEINGVFLSGKFDVVDQGRVKDIKNTKTYNWIKGTNDEKYALQGSMYRWLNPDIIKDDNMDVEMIFNDWSQFKAMVDKQYPQKAIMTRTLPLLDPGKTEAFIIQTIGKILKYADAKQSELPRCTPEELWMDPPKWAYYKDRTKTVRATKLFSTEEEAFIQKAKDGNTGMVVKREMKPKFCEYCAARGICLQADEYVKAGLLEL